ncbi:hypothetical protein DPMN_057117 [Dreissena polymorpha]|uniref:Uncharacterized protein n=1 Tax=Dreissena polymorpha TaxID=45954 RepID=A0A9D4HS39_DREPO|nr:hypothetical protein DPMN_057117 [Dreissena polymorpha]
MQCIKPECPRLNVTNGRLLGNMNNNGSRKQVTCNLIISKRQEQLLRHASTETGFQSRSVLLSPA